MSEDAPLFVNLSPRESQCAVCELWFVESPFRGCGIAMFEGEPVPHDFGGDWGGFPCCKTCFDEFERVQANEGERRVWFASKRREARLRCDREPVCVGDL